MKINTLTKLIAGAIFIINQILNLKKLKISLPSITYSINLFSLSKGSKVIIGKRAIIMKYCKIISKGEIKIGSNFCMNKYSRIVSHHQIIIGNNVTIAQFVSILDHDHNYYIQDNQLKLDGYKTASVNIGNNVWIADKVTICKGVTIGDNVIIAANSVINKNVPSNSIYGGVPAKLLKKINHD
jgi:acetyltransferase-like isoleucine patch superfamily enzyme